MMRIILLASLLIAAAFFVDASLAAQHDMGAQHEMGAHRHPAAEKIKNPVAPDATSIAAGKTIYATNNVRPATVTPARATV